jgi:transcriptional regulator with XRE-family HTH domain
MSTPPNPVFSLEYERLRGVLIAARKASGMSQEALALRLGRGKSFVTMFENGQRRLDILDFHNLVVALGRDPLVVAEVVFDGFRPTEITIPEGTSTSSVASPNGLDGAPS